MIRLEAGLLTLNGTLVAQLLVFLVTLGVLYWLAWGRLLAIFQARQARIQEGLEAAERAKQEREAAERDYRARLDEARREGERILDNIAKQGEDLRRELEAKAKQDADAVLARARAEIEQERQTAVQDLRRQVADLTVLAASRIIGESLDGTKHRQLIDQTIEEAKIGA
jgi:F-type H+-transporting ATPase subunit b